MTKVVSPDEMDDETFCRHMMHRHAEDVKMKDLKPSAVLPAWRAYHRTLHRLRQMDIDMREADVRHEHDLENESQLAPSVTG